MTQQLITTALLIAGCAYLPAAQESTSTLTKEDVPAEVRALTLEIVTGISEDSLQIIALYDWLTSNIRYDGAGTGGQRINRSAADVLRRRKAICFGYAQLLQQMCTVLDIPAHVISGYSNQSGRGNASQAPDHAWNAVCFNDQWRLIDATWGAAQTGKRQKSQQAWLFVAPEEFLSSHLPAQPVWQLLDCPVDRQWQPSLPCGYHDTLQQFLALPPAQRKLEEARMAFGFHPTEANRTEFLQTLIDRAIEVKEVADTSASKTAVVLYGEALSLFDQARQLRSEWFDWQEQAWAFTLLNAGQVRLGALTPQSANIETLREIRESVVQAGALLAALPELLQGGMARQQCADLIHYLEQRMASLKR